MPFKYLALAKATFLQHEARKTLAKVGSSPQQMASTCQHLTTSTPAIWPGQALAGPGPATPLSISASQIKTWLRCHRLWWFEKCCGLVQPQKHFFIVGKALHGVAERFLTDVRGPDLYPAGWDHDLTPDESRWVRTSAELAIKGEVWKRSEGLLVEYPFLAVIGSELDGLPQLLPAVAEQRAGAEEGERQVRPVPGVGRCVTGFMDGVDFGEGLVLDHKTTKHSGYAKTERTLAEDEQMLLYAAIVLAHDRDRVAKADEYQAESAEDSALRSVTVRHNVFLKNVGLREDGTREDPVYPVDAVIHRAEAVAFWSKVVAMSEEMLKVRQVPVGEGLAKADNWEQVEGEANPGHSSPAHGRSNQPGLRAALEAAGNEHACSSYGGCVWKDVCWGRCKASQVVAKLLPPAPPPKPTPLIFRPGRYVRNSPN